MFITILVLSSMFILLYNYYVYHKKYGQLLNLTPGPSGFPIIGNALQLYVSAGMYKISNLFTLIDKGNLCHVYKQKFINLLLPYSFYIFIKNL